MCLQNHLSQHLGGQAVPWSAEEMLGGQRRRVNTLAYARITINWPHVEKTRRGSLLNHPSCPPTIQLNRPEPENLELGWPVSENS